MDHDTLLQRARRALARGEHRKGLLALREACMRNEGSASTWALYGARAVAFGRADEGRRALAHAVWLRRRAGDEARATSTARALARA